MADESPHDQQPKDSKADGDSGRIGFFNVLHSVFAAIFGIQSNKNRVKDFEKGDPSQYIVMGIISVVALVVVMIIVVKSVLGSAGG